MSRPVGRVRHKKRGSQYLVLGDAEVQMSTPTMTHTMSGERGHFLTEGQRLTVYRADDDKLWARRPDEFDDGRFEPSASPEDSPLRDELARVLELVASEGLTHPRSLDAALDAIGAALRCRADEVLEATGSASGPYYLDALLEGLS